MSYKIYGTYQGCTEVIDTADTAEECRYLIDEYKMAFGNSWVIYSDKPLDTEEEYV